MIVKEFFDTPFKSGEIGRFNLESHFKPTFKISCNVLLNSYPKLKKI